MSDQKENHKADATAAPAEPADPSAPAAPEAKTADPGAPPVPAEAKPAAVQPDAETGIPSLKMSPEMEAALREAEAHVRGAPAAKAAPAADADEPAFDPNAVEPADATPPLPKPTPAEFELRLQIVELRGQVRDRDKELERKAKELSQNAEQARHIQKQFDNYKARVMKEKADWFNYGHEPILKELLEVIDNLERALAHADGVAEIKSLREGVELILRQFRALLEKFGVTAVESEGRPFNPEYHQAMVQIVDDTVPVNTVVQVHQKGYRLKDRLLRPAMVVVSKPGAKPAPDKVLEEPPKSSEGAGGT